MSDVEASLTVAADLRNLERIRRFIRERAEAAGAAAADSWDLVQAVDESATNVIVHGYAGAPGEVEVRMRCDADQMVVRIIDEAPTFDPTTVPEPDLDLPLDRRPLGRMGVHLSRELTDEIRHRTAGGRGNELTLVKRYSGGDPGRRRPAEQEAR